MNWYGSSKERFFNLIQESRTTNGVIMTTKLSRMYGMDIFTDGGKFLGNAQDFIINLGSGEVSRVLTEHLPSTKEDLKRSLNKTSIFYKNVKSVEDVMVISKGAGVQTDD